jgi:hypothetical protein
MITKGTVLHHLLAIPDIHHNDTPIPPKPLQHAWYLSSSNQLPINKSSLIKHLRRKLPNHRRHSILRIKKIRLYTRINKSLEKTTIE